MADEAEYQPNTISGIMGCEECKDLVRLCASMRFFDHLREKHGLPGKEAEKAIRWVYERLRQI
jgi:hypothetical protein